ncbi:MAG: hypothetical protein JW982_16785 [Spirochaetes bacterium]|nr:hypothetical protein [Spirochaetota bacterium]
MNYFFCRQDLFSNIDTAEISGHTADTGKYFWTSGMKIQEKIPLQVLDLDTEYGTKLPAFFDTSLPVMSSGLIDAFENAGVDNFDKYPVILKRLDNGMEYANYFAVNFIGCIDALDKEKTAIINESFRRYSHVVIDEKKTQGFKCFRLKDGPSLLVVDENVKKKLENHDFYSLLLQKCEDYNQI